MDKIEEVKKILEHYFSEQLGEGASIDIAKEICQLMDEEIAEENIGGEDNGIIEEMVEPKPDESRLLTDEELLTAQTNFIRELGKTTGQILTVPLKGELRDAINREAQDAKTASIEATKWADALRKAVTELNQKDACQQRVEGIIAELNNCFELAPNDDRYLRILVKDTLEYIKTGKYRQEAGGSEIKDSPSRANVKEDDDGSSLW